MVKGPFFVILIFALLAGCSAPRSVVADRPLVSLPKQWTAIEITADQRCATPRRIAADEWWAFCDGQGPHGILRRFNEHRQLLGEQTIPSIDRLAMANSVSKNSSWVELAAHVYVGTEDGRLLMLDHRGAVKKTHHFGDHVWVQKLALINDELVVVASRYQDVRIVRLSEDLEVLKTATLGNALHEAEMIVEGSAIIVATDRGFLLELNSDLFVNKLWRLSPGASLGVPTIVGKNVWVGNSEGRLYHVKRDGDFTSVVVGASSITSAPVVTVAGTWVALDEEGLLKMVDRKLTVQRQVRVPLSRTLLSFESLAYHGHMLLGVASDRHYLLLSAEGETLLDMKADNASYQLSSRGKDLWLGEWQLSPSEREPASK